MAGGAILASDGVKLGIEILYGIYTAYLLQRIVYATNEHWKLYDNVFSIL